MAANDREFTLIGKFDDQITKKLKEINEAVSKLNKPLSKDNFTKSIVDGFTAANKELGALHKGLEAINKFQMKFDKSGITAAKEEAEALGRAIRDVEKAGFQFDRSGLKAAQEDASVLGDILNANALIKVGEGFANALTTGATAAVNILQKGAGFFGQQFNAAVQDQMEDLQARGSLFGALTKAGVLKGGTAADMEAGYRQTKIISRANEQAIGELIRTSSVSTSVVTTLNRQMTDNLLPTLLKARGITSLSGKSRDEMDKLFGGEKGKPGIGTELARIYEQMATVIPNPAYASMAGMGFTQAITQGTVNRQLAVFENNPVLVDALKTIDGGIQGTADVGKRIQILRKALEVAAPTMMLEEMRQTLGGGFQAVQDTIMNPTVGILSLGADIANEGKKTLQQYKATQADEIQRDRVVRNLNKLADKRKLEGAERDAFIEKHKEMAMKKLYEAVENADSPIEKISVGLAPVLQSFASFINTFGNLFLGPVTSAMNSLYGPLASLQTTLDYLTTDVELFNKTGGKKGRSIGEALGRAFAEIFKALAQYFNPQKAGKEIGDGINNFFSDFMKGFKSDKIDGEKYLKIVMDTLQSIIMKMLFKEGDITKGMTGLGSALTKVFLLLAAPAFIMSVVNGLIPIALMSMGGLIKKVFEKMAPALLAKVGLGAGAEGAGLGGVIAGVLANPLTWVVLASILAKATEPVVKAVAPKIQKKGEEYFKTGLNQWDQAMALDSRGKTGEALGMGGTAFASLIMGELTHVVNDFMLGFNQVFAGLADLVVGLFSDPAKVSEGINKIFEGLWRLFTMIGHLIMAIIYAIPGIVLLILNAFKNLFQGIGMSIMAALSSISTAPIGKAIGQLYNGIAKRISEMWAARPSIIGGRDEGQKATLGGKQVVWRDGKWVPQTTEARAFGDANPFMGSLGEAINFEMANKPAGSHLVIANSSETIIPAAGGFGGGLKEVATAIWNAAEQTSAHMASALEKSSSATMNLLSKGFAGTSSALAAGFDRSSRESHRSMEVISRQNGQVLQAIKAASAAGGFGMMGLGSGYGTGGVRIAGMLGNYIKKTGGAPGSIWEHPWHGGVRGRHARGSYHYAGRAIDIGAYAYEQGGVISRVNEFNRRMHVRPVEFLHAGNHPGHRDHVHVAYATGYPTVFPDLASAQRFEKNATLGNVKVSTITARDGEFGGGGITINAPVTIYQQPGQDAEQVARLAAIKIAMAVSEARNHM